MIYEDDDDEEEQGPKVFVPLTGDHLETRRLRFIAKRRKTLKGRSINIHSNNNSNNNNTNNNSDSNKVSIGSDWGDGRSVADYSLMDERGYQRPKTFLIVDGELLIS